MYKTETERLTTTLATLAEGVAKTEDETAREYAETGLDLLNKTIAANEEEINEKTYVLNNDGLNLVCPGEDDRPLADVFLRVVGGNKITAFITAGEGAAELTDARSFQVSAYTENTGDSSKVIALDGMGNKLAKVKVAPTQAPDGGQAL